MGLSLSGISGASGILPPPSGGSFDSDAQAFITATGITDSTQQNAINNLVLGFKSNGTWSKYAAIYPLVGGTAFRHSLNLRDPRDLDAAYRIAWNGTITHNANGTTGGGGFGNTFFAGNPAGMIAYTTGMAAVADSWGYESTSARMVMIYRFSNNASFFDFYSTNIGNGRFTTTVSGTDLGCLQMSLNSATRQVIATRNTSILVDAIHGGTPGSNPGFSMYVLGNNSSGSLIWASSRPHRFIAILSAFRSSSEMVADYNTIQAYQTALGRQV